MRKFAHTQVRWFVRLLLPLLLALPTTSGGVAVAQGESIAGEWEIIFQVRNSKIFATWIGRVWDYSEGNGVIIATRRVDISKDCLPFGGVEVGASDVTFDGVDDYFKCTIPNFQLIFAQMNPALVSCYCDFASPPYAAADITPVLSDTAQPLVYHERLYFDVLLADTQELHMPFLEAEGNDAPVEVVKSASNTNLGIARMNLRYPEQGVGMKAQSWESNLFDPEQEDGLQLWSGFDVNHFLSFTSQEGWAAFLADSGFWDAVTPDFAGGFLTWESQAIAKYAEEETPAGFLLGPGTPLYIGYNPETKTYFEGTIRAVAVDPGCRAH